MGQCLSICRRGAKVDDQRAEDGSDWVGVVPVDDNVTSCCLPQPVGVSTSRSSTKRWRSRRRNKVGVTTAIEDPAVKKADTPEPTKPTIVVKEPAMKKVDTPELIELSVLKCQPSSRLALEEPVVKNVEELTPEPTSVVKAENGLDHGSWFETSTDNAMTAMAMDNVMTASCSTTSQVNAGAAPPQVARAHCVTSRGIRIVEDTSPASSSSYPVDDDDDRYVVPAPVITEYFVPDEIAQVNDIKEKLRNGQTIFPGILDISDMQQQPVASKTWHWSRRGESSVQQRQPVASSSGKGVVQTMDERLHEAFYKHNEVYFTLPDVPSCSTSNRIRSLKLDDQDRVRIELENVDQTTAILLAMNEPVRRRPDR